MVLSNMLYAGQKLLVSMTESSGKKPGFTVFIKEFNLRYGHIDPRLMYAIYTGRKVYQKPANYHEHDLRSNNLAAFMRSDRLNPLVQRYVDDVMKLDSSASIDAFARSSAVMDTYLEETADSYENINAYNKYIAEGNDLESFSVEDLETYKDLIEVRTNDHDIVHYEEGAHDDSYHAGDTIVYPDGITGEILKKEDRTFVAIPDARKG